MLSQVGGSGLLYNRNSLKNPLSPIHGGNSYGKDLAIPLLNQLVKVGFQMAKECDRRRESSIFRRFKRALVI
jgi:hypothetical protein